MTVLSRKKVLAKTGYKTVNVPVDEIEEGGVVIVRELSGYERVKYQKRVKQLCVDENGNATDRPDEDQALTILVILIILSCIDENNQPLFTDEDIEYLKNYSPIILERIGTEAMKLNGVTSEQITEAKNKLGKVDKNPSITS